jgi:hypothetical protein
MGNRLMPLLAGLAALGMWLSAMTGLSVGQEALGAGPVGTNSTTNQASGTDAGVARSFADFLKAEAERSERAVQTSADALKTYTDLLRNEAERSEQASKHEMDTIERTLGRFISVIQAFGWMLTGIAAVAAATLAFFNFRTVRDIRRRAEGAFEEQLTDFRKTAQSTFTRQIEQARTDLETLRNDVQRRAEDINASFSSINDDVTKLTSDLVSRREALTQSQPGVPPSEPDYNGKCIIWIDDQPHTTMTAREELARYGIKTTAVEDTHTLEEKLADPPGGKPYDLIISDMRRGVDRRAGLDYFKTVIGKGLPKRMIFAPNSLVRPVENEIRQLQQRDNGFLGAVTAKEPFFAKVFEALRSG